MTDEGFFPSRFLPFVREQKTDQMFNHFHALCLSIFVFAAAVGANHKGITAAAIYNGFTGSALRENLGHVRLNLD